MVLKLQSLLPRPLQWRCPQKDLVKKLMRKYKIKMGININSNKYKSSAAVTAPIFEAVTDWTMALTELDKTEYI